MYLLIRECRECGRKEKLEILVYETDNEAFVEARMDYHRIAKQKKYKDYYLYNDVLNYEFFEKNRNERWENFEQLLYGKKIALNDMEKIRIEYISMLIEGGDKEFEECDKIFSILMYYGLDKKNLKRLKKNNKYLEIENETVECSRCHKVYPIPKKNKLYGFYGNNLRANCFEVKTGSMGKYFEIRGQNCENVEIDGDKDKYEIEQIFCWGCINNIHRTKFRKLN